jgi:hypothetical protein
METSGSGFSDKYFNKFAKRFSAPPAPEETSKTNIFFNKLG